MNTIENEIQNAAFGIEQSLLRFAAGQDLEEPETLGSAFTPDASLDFRHPAGALGVTVGVIQGRREIVSTIVATTDHLVTSHTITNVRVLELSAGAARAHALIEAMYKVRDCERVTARLLEVIFAPRPFVAVLRSPLLQTPSA